VLTSMRVDRFFLHVEAKKPYLSMESVTGVHQLGPCARVRLHPTGQRRTGLFHGAQRKTHRGGALGRLLFVTTEPHSLSGGRRTAPRKTGGDVAAGPPPCRTSP
jgi:hypothetical protein